MGLGHNLARNLDRVSDPDDDNDIDVLGMEPIHNMATLIGVPGHTPQTIRMLRFDERQSERISSNDESREQELLDRVNRFITLHEMNGFTLIGLHPVVVEGRVTQYLLFYRLTNPSGLSLLEFDS